MKLHYFLFILSGGVVLAGCSSSATKNANDTIDYDAETDYRDTEEQLSESLEMPPNLFALSKDRDDFNRALNAQNSTDPEAGYRYIPTYRAKNIVVRHNLKERWLEVDGIESEEVWKGIQEFLVSMGFKVKEARKDIGFIKTEFLSRKELVPLDDQGPLTRLLNSWRPELAEGVYDRLIARVATDKDTKTTRVYFYHYMVFNPEQTEEDQDYSTDDGWKIKPYNPMIEAEALYQAMIFFGALQSQAFTEVESTVKLMEPAIGDKEEVSAIKFKAPRDMAWNYVTAMVYRVGWNIEQSHPGTYQAWIQLPEKAREDDSLASSLSFWSDKKSKVLPELIRLSFNELPQSDEYSTELTVDSGEGEEPLTGEQRELIFKSLGLMADN